MAGKVILNDNVASRIIDKGMSVNEAISDVYFGEIQDKCKENKLFENMTPIQIALFDAGITKKSTIADMVNAATYTTNPAQGGDWLFPAFVESRLSEFVQKNPILQYLVKTETSVQSMVSQSVYLDMTDPENEKGAKKARVAEGADLPLAVLKIGNAAINLHKYGRAVQQTYEAAMMMRVDMFSKTLDMIANDVTNQEVEEASRVALVGDGNDNAAKSLLTTGSKNIVTAEELRKALLEYWYQTGMVATTVVAGKDMFESLSAMQFDANKGNGASNKFILNTPQLPVSQINLVCARNDLKVGANNVALLLNDEMSLTKHVFAGSLMREMANNIRNQTKLGTISEITGFSKNMPDGVKIITSHA